MTEQALDGKRALVTAIGHEVPVSKKRYLELVHTLADMAQNLQRESQLTTASWLRIRWRGKIGVES